MAKVMKLILYCLWILSRETSVDSNSKLTQIFIKYMHDIVLEISFLDINSQNWITGSHLKLLPKSLKIQYIFQKFLCTAYGPNRYDFWIHFFFVPGHFWSIFENWYLKMKSRGLYHAYILWKSGLLLDFQQLGGP